MQQKNMLIELMKTYPPLIPSIEKLYLTLLHTQPLDYSFINLKLLLSTKQYCLSIILISLPYKPLQKKLRDLLVYHNSRFIYQQTLSFHQGKEITREELFNYGVCGLLEAIDNFDITKNYRLLTYAYWRIKGELYAGFIKLLRVIQLPSSVENNIRKINKYQEKNPYCTYQDIARDLKMPIAHIKHWLNINYIYELDKGVQQDSKHTWLEYLTNGFEDYSEVIDLKTRAEKVIKLLPIEYQATMSKILLEYYTVKRVAYELNKPIEEINTILDQSIQLLKSPLFKVK